MTRTVCDKLGLYVNRILELEHHALFERPVNIRGNAATLAFAMPRPHRESLRHRRNICFVSVAFVLLDRDITVVFLLLLLAEIRNQDQSSRLDSLYQRRRQVLFCIEVCQYGGCCEESSCCQGAENKKKGGGREQKENSPAGFDCRSVP